MFNEETLDKFIDKAVAGEAVDGLGDPLAELAGAVMRLNAIAPDRQVREEKRRLIMTRARESRPTRGWGSVKNRLSIGIAAGLALVLSSGGVVFAASGSLPGETLYPIKRAVENASLALKPPGLAKARARVDLARTRQAEIKSLIKQGKGKAVGSLVGELNYELTKAGANLKSLPAGKRNEMNAEIRALSKWTATILKKKAPETKSRRLGGKPAIFGPARAGSKPALKSKRSQPGLMRPAQPAETESRRPGTKRELKSKRPEKAKQ